MVLSHHVKPLIEQKKFDDVEALWMNHLESNPSDVDEFIAVAKSLRKSEERSRADTLLGLLSDTLKQKGAWRERLQVLKEIGRLAKNPGTLRALFEEALTEAYKHKPSFKRVMQHVKFAETGSNPVERAEKAETWLTYDEGECYFMAGRGAGRVIELNPDLGVCRVDFEKDKRVSVPLGAAHKFLIPLRPGHLLRRKLEDEQAFKAEAVKQPAETFAKLLQSFGRAMSVSEVRDSMIGIVPDEKWTSWWTAARKHPQIVIGGAGAKATYAWNASSGAAEASITREFDRADVRSKLELAKKHSSRSSELADYFSSSLVSEASRISRSDPTTAWEVLTVLEKLPGKFERALDPSSLLSGAASGRMIALIKERQLREKALDDVRRTHPEWFKVYSEVFFLDSEPRVLSRIISELESAGKNEIRNRLVDETLRYPGRHVNAFYWYCKMLQDSGALPDRTGYPLINQMLDAIGNEDFGSLRARFKEFFDKGNLAIRIVMASDNEEQARKLVESIERHGGLEEYRRDILKSAILMKLPQLREQPVEPLYATADKLAEKRAEFERLKSVEMPANLKAIQEAREMGDLRENFEYKAARQRQEYLTARVTELSGELNRVRVLDPEEVDATEGRVGTKIVLVNGEVRREVTILGPWESSPEHGIYSYQSDAGHALIGKHAGDLVSFMGNDYEIESIARWR